MPTGVYDRSIGAPRVRVYTDQQLVRRKSVQKAYRKSHRTESHIRNAKWMRTSKARFNNLVKGARVRNVDVTITFNEWKSLINNPCFYCAGELPQTGGGIDRRDSSLGYVEGNCRPCCTVCNIAKNDLTEEEFRTWLLKVSSHWLNRK
jgi:hypothetical protein